MSNYQELPEINASSTPSAPQVPNGTYEARCVQMVFLGTVKHKFKNEESESKDVRLTFELPNEWYEFEDASGNKVRRMRTLSKEFSLYMSKKANLRKFLANWRGSDFTEEEAKKFNVVKLIGVPALITVMVNEKGYSEITGATIPPKSMVMPVQHHPSQVLTYEHWNEEIFKSLPDYVKKKMMETPEYLEMDAKRNPKKAEPQPVAAKKSPQPVPAEHIVGEGEDDLPF